MQRNSCKIFVKEFIFSTGLHLAGLLKNVTHPWQVFTKRLHRFLENLFLGQDLRGCLLQNSVKVCIAIQYSVTYIYH